ncbi:PA14 domain-containing protein [Larkinella sp. GY13]|uniref:PA14 domain-containing protein n=1 Tax=Larkinella sp. GY13 TaxID=3453720 RepID=UPI003EECA0C9
MRKRIYLAGGNRALINLIALLTLLSLPSFRFSNINKEEKFPTILLKNMEKPATYVLEKSRNPGSGKSRRSILSPSYPSPNRKSASSGSDPIRFVFYTNKKQVSLGEEVELTITAHYMAMHPGLLATFPGSNAFSLKVLVPDGFVQTGGDYVDLIGTELSTQRKTVTYSLKGKFVSISSNNTFRLLRSHKDAGADSKFIEKGKFQIHCHNSAESLANAGSLKGSRIAAELASLTGCYIIRSKKTGQLLQSLSGDVVEQRTANNQANQIWKAESVGANQYRFTTQDGSGKTMQVNAASQGELVRIGTYTGADLQKWTLQSDNNGSYRLITSNGLTWDMRNYGAEPQLQLWGNLTEDFADQRLFGFESTGCPTAPPATGSCTTLRNADSPANLTSGLTYKYYQSIANNDWCSATGFSNQAIVSSGSVGTISLTPRQRDDHFGFEFAGYIQVPADGQYTFFITSDDDSQLLIGDQLIAADRGCHGINSTGQEPNGNICLRAGYHPIQILYSQGTEGLGLKTFWQGPTFAKQEIPASALFRSGSATVACNFVVSATAPATAGCGSAITLNAPCTGSDCDGVSYQWSTGQNGQSVNTTAAGNNGTTTYAVTSSKAGCDTKTAQTSVTVNGCESSLTGCYVIRSKKTGQLLQSLSGEVVEQRTANSQANQIWKAESVGTNQYRFTTQDGSGKSMQVNAASQGELLRIGTYTGADLQKWTIQSDNNGSYRINTSNGLTWDMRNYGAEPQLQLWGNLTEGFADQRLFGFESTGCPTAPPATGSCTTLRNADSPANLTSGLTYKYYQSIANNDWCSATGFSNQAIVSSGSVGTISLTPRQRDDHFGFEFAGYIQVPADGQYTFFITSDDDSQLLIGDQLIAADRGCHGINSTGQEPNGNICLRAGYHPIQILYSQGTEGLGLKTFWQGPTFAKQEISASALFRSGTPTTVGCNFVVSATAPATANCSSAITLNAPCTGADCDGVSYQWSTGQNGQSVNITAAGNNGTTTYAVTASKAGCDNKIAQATVTVSSCPSSTNVATKTFMMTSIVGEEWSDKKDYGTRKYVNMPEPGSNLPSPHRLIPPKNSDLKVTKIRNIAKIMDYWQQLGGTHVSMPMKWDDTEMSPGEFEFRHWDYIFAKADSHGLKVNINIWPLLDFSQPPASSQYNTSAPWRYEGADAAQKFVSDANGGHTEPINHFMSYHSSKMANYRRWLNGVANYLATKANLIGYVAVVVNHHKEANYYLNAYTDYHPSTVSAWQDWHDITYSGRPNPPVDGGSSLNHKRWLQFRSKVLIDFVKEWVGIFKAKNIKTVLDVGSFTDSNDKRGTWALLGMLPPELDGVKHNPGYNYQSAFETRIVATARPSLASVEWSNECNEQPCPSTLVPTLIDKIKTSIDAGATDISFAIFDLPLDYFPPGNDLEQVVNALKNSGYWNKTIQSLPNNCVMEVKVTDALNNGSYNGGSIINIFNNFQNNNNGCVTWPAIKVIDDLKNLN